MFTAALWVFLDRKLLRKPTGRGGLVPWPPRSSDLTQLGFYIKEAICFRPMSTNLPELTARIQATAATIKPATPKNIGLNVSTNKICAWLLAVAPRKMCS